MHITRGKLFTIQKASFHVPTVLTGLLTDPQHFHLKDNLARLEVYKDNVLVAVLETTTDEIKKYLKDRFNFIIYSIKNES